MRRFLIVTAASSLALVLVVGGLGFLALRGTFGTPVAEAASFGKLAARIPPEIRDLHSLPAEERFTHFLGGQMRFTDTNNSARTLNVTPGTITSLSSDRLTIKANDASIGSKTYTLTGETVVHTAGGRPWSEGEDQSALKSGDQVVVVSLDNSGEARAVIAGGADGFGPHRGPFRSGRQGR